MASRASDTQLMGTLDLADPRRGRHVGAPAAPSLGRQALARTCDGRLTSVRCVLPRARVCARRRGAESPAGQRDRATEPRPAWICRSPRLLRCPGLPFAQEPQEFVGADLDVFTYR